MSTTKLIGRENLTKSVFWLGPVGPNDKENHVKMHKSTVLVTLSRGSGSVSKGSGTTTLLWIRPKLIGIFLGFICIGMIFVSLFTKSKNREKLNTVSQRQQPVFIAYQRKDLFV